MPYLEDADALLDIHSSGTETARPFVIAEPMAHQIAKYLPVPVISSGWDAIEPGATDGYMNSLNKIGICVECGFHEDGSSVDVAERAIRSFIAACGNSDDPVTPSNAQYIEVESMYKTRTDFTPSRQFDDFEPVKAGTVIGMDGGQEVRMEKGGLVIFVRARKLAGEEAFVAASADPRS
jgi:predicted deacylase